MESVTQDDILEADLKAVGIGRYSENDHGRMELARIRARRGAALLDRQDVGIRDNWRQKIVARIEEFAMSDPFHCVCGLTFGDYTVGIQQLGLGDDHNDSYPGVVNHGFEHDGYTSYSDLKVAWLEIVNA